MCASHIYQNNMAMLSKTIWLAVVYLSSESQKVSQNRCGKQEILPQNWFMPMNLTKILKLKTEIFIITDDCIETFGWSADE